MAKDLLNTYIDSWKTSYYQNTMDGKVEDVIQELAFAPRCPFDDDGEGYVLMCVLMQRQLNIT